MNQGEAVAIVRDIFRTDKGAIEKTKAIRIVMDMETINSITKDELRNVIRWKFGMPERKIKKRGETADGNIQTQ